ncbi:MAG: M48 family metallopeptidase [Bacteroidota bacterium]
MSRHLLVLLVFFIFSTTSFAQSRVNFGRPEGDITASSESLDAPALMQRVYANLPEEGTGNLDERTMMSFVNLAVRSTDNVLRGGLVYTDWPEMQDYVDQVLELILPPELGTGIIKAHVIKDGGKNAFMTPTGHFFINVGFFGDVATESGLAGVMAHELAHYTKQHGLQRFVKAEQGDFKTSIFFSGAKATSQFSVANEMESDATAREYMLTAGYNLGGLVDVFSVLKRSTDKALLRYADRWEFPETTHPSSDRRLKTINAFLDQEENTGADYLVSEKTFKKLRKAAKFETLKYLMANYNYDACLATAFRYHIFNPSDPTFVYYTMESIRRKCYLDATKWSKPFLVDGYHDVTERKGKPYKEPIRGHFFSRFRPLLLGLSEDGDLTRVPAKFYWQGDPKFKTNEEAFQYFYQIGKVFKEPECILSNALSLSFDQAKMNAQLEQYLDYEVVKHRTFAEALLAGEAYSSLPDKKLTVFHRFVMQLKQAGERISLTNTDEDAQLMQAAREAVGTFAERDFVYLPSLRTTDGQRYRQLSALERFSLYPFVSRGDKAEIHLLDPNIWEALHYYQVNEVEFVNCLYSDNLKGDYTLEAYRQVIEASADDYLGLKDEKGRYLSFIFSAIRLEEDAPMKTQESDFGNKLSNSATAYEELQALLAKKLAKLDD